MKEKKIIFNLGSEYAYNEETGEFEEVNGAVVAEETSAELKTDSSLSEDENAGVSTLSLDDNTTTLGSYSWVDGTMSNTVPVHQVGTVKSTDGVAPYRMYMNFTLPVLPRNPRIKKAELTVYQTGGMPDFGDLVPRLGLYQVTEDITTGTCTPAYDANLLDYEYMKPHGSSDTPISYTFDITKLVDAVNKGEITSPKLMIKAVDESVSSSAYVVLYGSGSSANKPVISITYESGYGVNTSYRTHTHEIGRYGQGSVDLQCGNLMFETDDFAWAGNRMPVTIKHLYNSALAAYQYTSNSAIKLNTADFGAMKLGYGWKLNIMQSMMAADFTHEGVDYSGYVYIGENGEEYYFVKSSETRTDATGNDYCLYEEVEDKGMLYDPVTLVLEQDEKYQFDASGRLIKVTDAYGNHMDIAYNSGKISSVTDGAGRQFVFAYNSDGYVTSVIAPDGTAVSYTYVNGFLNYVIYPDGSRLRVETASGRPTYAAAYGPNWERLGMVRYEYAGERVSQVFSKIYEGEEYVTYEFSEYDYSAASRRTVVTTTEAADADEGETSDNVIRTVYTFDDEGNIVSEYMYSVDTGNTGVSGSGSGINPYSGDGAGVICNANNLLKGHSFESLDDWTATDSNGSTFTAVSTTYETVSKFGNLVLLMNSGDSTAVGKGVYQQTDTLPVGQYTLSAYMKVTRAFTGDTAAGAYIRVTDISGNILAESEHLTQKDSGYIRLTASFELASAQAVKVCVYMDGDGQVYVDGAQLENNPFANPYNMLINGNFENNLTGWTASSVAAATDECFDMSKSAKATGGLTTSAYLYQDVVVKKRINTRETFTLSGWAKGYGLVERERSQDPAPTFRLRALIQYNDGTYETHTADFSPCTEEWQYASVQFAKSQYKTLKTLRVFCDYNYNFGTAYFDNIQLVRDSIETGLGAGDFVVESDYEEEEETTEAVDETVEDTAPEFEEAVDAYGNALTETTFMDGEFGTIYRAFGYNGVVASEASVTDEVEPAVISEAVLAAETEPAVVSETNATEIETLSETASAEVAANAGNDLISETDARGNVTQYTVNEVTSRNEEIVDRLGNKTAYEYDTMGRTTKVTSKDAADTELANVSYTYDGLDNMTEIVRGDGMKYVLAYNNFHNLESIGIEGKDEKLVAYTYKSGNGRLKEMMYANGDKMKASYNSAGGLVAERWYDASENLTAHYKYVYDGQGNVVRSIDVLSLKEYNYSYEDGRITRSTECNITLNESGLVIKKNLVNSIIYYYDQEGNLARKRIIPATGSEQVIYYENPENENTVVKFTAGGKTVTSHSKNDSFGRKVFDELQLGTGFVSRQFDYHAGEVTEEHLESDKLKSTPTTQLVKRITLSDGRTLDYEYDGEERITKVVDSYKVAGSEAETVEAEATAETDEAAAESTSEESSETQTITTVTEYTYDSLGQLLTETVNGTVVNTMTYDNYGNILTKNGVAYTYGDSVWKDKLTGYGDQSITYDAQGNPTSYLGHTLSWEKGRQLKQLTKSDGTAVSYTYDANGIRTSKTVGNTKHTYTLDGTKILKEVWGSNTLIPLYDNEDSVCGIILNDEPYYFYKNQQGDIIALANKDSDVIARYTYDAWGKVLSVTDAEGSEVTDPTNIANINPYRYRGYYYDTETELYYLQSRYYNPVVGRFLNGDECSCIFGAYSSDFAYCNNNPVNKQDESGYIAAKVVGAAIGAIIGVVGGKFLGNWLADVLKLKGWKRKIFVAAVAALVGAAAGVIGSFIGPYVAKIATKLGRYIAELVRKGKIALKKLSSKVKSSLRTLFSETCCFVGGTQISTPDGEKAIDKIVAGDNVYAINPENGQIGIKKVSKVFTKQTNTLYHVVTSNEEIVTTDEHPFWINGKGWVAACNLCQGDSLCLQSKGTVKITDISVEKLDNPVTVYNFEVEDWHTYFVGSDKILVHNKCSLTKIKDSYLKQKGLDAHSIKKEFVGKNNISKYDLFYDKDSGLIFLLRKGAKATEAIATGYFIK